MIASALILAAVMAVAVARPRGLQPAWPAFAGAVACFALRLVHVRELVRVLELTWNATLTLLGLMLLSAVLAQNGAFRAAAHRIARTAGGDGRRLFLGLCLLTAGAAAIVANDGAILILTPIVCDLGALLGLTADATLALAFAVGFLCDAFSTVLPAANLTNILLVDTLGLHPGAFFARMLGPSFAALLGGTGALALELRASLPRRYDVTRLGPAPPFSARSRRATLTAFAVLIGGYGLAALVHLPLGLVVVASAGLLASVEHASGAIDAQRIARRLPYSIVLFATSMFVVVTAVVDHGAGAWLERGFQRFTGDGRPGLFAIGGLVSALSAVANNLPVLLASTLGLKSAGLGAGGLPYAALIGANIGEKVTPLGSLATLLWLDVLHARGVRIGWGRYLKLALFPTVAALVAALAVLALV